VRLNRILLVLTASVSLSVPQGLKADPDLIRMNNYREGISLNLIRPDTLLGNRSITIVNYDQLVTAFTKKDNVLYVVNFWFSLQALLSSFYSIKQN